MVRQGKEIVARLGVDSMAEALARLIAEQHGTSAKDDVDRCTGCGFPFADPEDEPDLGHAPPCDHCLAVCADCCGHEDKP